MTMFELEIQPHSTRTRITVRQNALKEVGSLLAEVMRGQVPPHVVVCTDERVGPLYARDLLGSLATAGFDTSEFRIQRGEASKCLAVAETFYEFLARRAVGRDAVILALGGGVVSDLAGFVTATWMRGVRFVICPTTLEADVDASLGGKTAVNTQAAKNLVGALHQPELVVVDPVCLASLDPRDIRSGLAESVKHALISSEAFLAWHEDHVDALLGLDAALMEELILRNLRIKAGFVEKDACERVDVRVMLNFGHTIGHAIEACCGHTLRHGECVSLGMLAACRLSAALGLLDDAVVARAQELLVRLGLPTVLADPIEPDRILATIRHDKKGRGGADRYVLLNEVGQPLVRDDIPESEVRKAYESLLSGLG